MTLFTAHKRQFQILLGSILPEMILRIANDSVRSRNRAKYWIVVSLPELIPRFGRRKINTQIEKLREGRCKILEESIFILRVKLHHLSKFRILDQDHIAVRFNHMSQ